jgi:hypothetical protein
MSPKRRIKDLRRRVRFRIPNRAELIVCEGSRTEPAYFNGLKRKLRLPAVQVDVVASEDASCPADVVTCAIARKKEGAREGLPYANIWCLMDVEIPAHHEALGEATDQARGKKIHVILSNPFFEYWLLLHFEKVITPFKTDRELQNALKRVHPTYKKTRIGFDRLYPLVGTAIKHAEEVLRQTDCGATI